MEQLEDFVSTSLACIVANLVTHPLEMLKVRQQLSVGSVGFSTLTVNIIRTEGPKALYKGLSAGLFRAVISGGGRLMIYNQLKMLSKEDNVVLRIGMGSAAGMIAAIFAAPFDLVRTVQQANVGSAPSALGVMKNIAKVKGPLALWSGSSAILARQAIFTAAQLVSYDKAKLFVSTQTGLDLQHFSTHMLASLVSGAFTTLATAPLEMIKTHMQMNSQNLASASFLTSFRTILRTEGVLAFWRGTTPLYLRVAPHTFIVLVLTEQFRRLFGVSQHV
eukprot:TRINITY_DN15734_c0_g1_i1.p1 TRINITY_DN15734_c0_g1~~TRINITY_DN15734_c0_g1_i1.p1  ORF type:complete len:289 (-),score=42.09 TRINITY_DN15734_c0_g1_i1:25-852(-)